MSIEAFAVSWETDGILIVDQVSLAAPEGGVLGVLGPNGSGKSTLLRMLSGQLRPASGQVVLDGRPIASWQRRAIARRMAVVEQHSTTEDDLSVEDVIDLGRIPHRAPWAGRSPRDRVVAGAAARRAGVENQLHRRWHTLSGGEQQRVQLARAFAQETGILLLDEPTNHLDIRAQLEILALVRAAPATVVVALHDLNLAGAFCDEVLVLRSGRAVARGSPEDVLTAELVGDVYGVGAVVDPTPDGPMVRFLAPKVRW